VAKGPTSAGEKSGPGPAQRQLGILELDRFSQASLTRWKELSEDLDELQACLFFGLRPEQRRLRSELISALQTQTPIDLPLQNWVRNVSYRFSLDPLSAAGSLLMFGGRFNPGVDLDADTLSPFPALYVAEDAETAFREKFQLPSTGSVDGLRPQELALAQTGSFSTVIVNGHMRNVFDMTSPKSLDPIAKILGRIKMPERARRLRTKLEIGRGSLFMMTTGRQLYSAMLEQNWRGLPAQFGLPAPSHTIAELIREAAFDAILYRSTKGSGRCLAIFPDRLSAGSYVELADAPPVAVKTTKLDETTGELLAGWDVLPKRDLPR